MSLAEIQNAASGAMINEEIPTDDGLCRTAVQLLLALASKVDVTPPQAKHYALVWPAPTSDPQEENIHYAFLAESDEGTLIINPVKAAGFPLYNKINDSKPGRIPEMVKTDAVV